jgi:hypothetical protein
MPRSDPPHVWVDRKTATAAEAFARTFREWRASGAESQTISYAGPHAKYAVFTWARPPGETVAIAHRVDSSRSRRAIVASRTLRGCFDERSIGMRT